MADDIVQKVEIQGVNEAVADLDRLASAGEKAFDRLAGASEKTQDLGKGIDAAGATAPPQLARIEKAAEDLGASLGKTALLTAEFTGKLVKLSGVAGGAAAGAMFALAKAASNTTNAVRDAGIAAGVTAQEFARMRFAAEQSGASGAKLERVFSLINSNTDELNDKLKKFGVELRNGNGTARDASAVFKDFADVIARTEDPQRRAAIAAEVFGRRVGPGLVELLSEGSKGITALGKDAERLGLVFTKAELEVGDRFGDSLGKLISTLGAFATRLGLAFSPAFIELFDKLSEAIAKVSPIVVSVAEAIGKNLTPAIKAVTDALGPTGLAIVAAVGSVGALALGAKTLLTVLGPFAGIIRLAFLPFTLLLSTASTGIKLLMSSFGLLTNAVRLFGLTSTLAFGPWGPLILLAAAAIGFLIVQLTKVDWAQVAQIALAAWGAIKQSVNDAVTSIQQKWDAFKQFWVDLWSTVTQPVVDAWNFITQQISNAWEFIKSIFTIQFWIDAWEAFKVKVGEAWDFLKTKAGEALDSLKQKLAEQFPFLAELIRLAGLAANALAGVRSASADAAAFEGGGFKGGGHVRGPGTSTSDSILARLSDGEFVVKAKAVDKYGLGLLHAINGMRLPLRALRGFAMGGLVDALGSVAAPRYAFATGGPVSTGGNGRPINLTIDGQSFGLVSRDNDTAERLTRFAIARQTRSAGKKPTYYGGI